MRRAEAYIRLKVHDGPAALLLERFRAGAVTPALRQAKPNRTFLHNRGRIRGFWKVGVVYITSLLSGWSRRGSAALSTIAPIGRLPLYNLRAATASLCRYHHSLMPVSSCPSVESVGVLDVLDSSLLVRSRPSLICRSNIESPAPVVRRGPTCELV